MPGVNFLVTRLPLLVKPPHLPCVAELTELNPVKYWGSLLIMMNVVRQVINLKEETLA